MECVKKIQITPYTLNKTKKQSTFYFKAGFKISSSKQLTGMIPLTKAYTETRAPSSTTSIFKQRNLIPPKPTTQPT